MANTGPMPISSGSQPATAKPRKMPIGLMLALGRFLVGHQHAGGCAVGELAGVAGGDELVVAAHGLQLGEAFQRGVGAIALVALQREGASW